MLGSYHLLPGGGLSVCGGGADFSGWSNEYAF